MIVFGTYFGGKTRIVNDQWIETKYALLMVPLIPLNTMFVTSSSYNKRNGFEISVAGKSVLHGYIRFFTFIISLAAWFAVMTGFSRSLRNDFPLPLYIIAGISSLIYTWSYFEHSKSKGKELIERTFLGSVLDINALPEWLPEGVRLTLLKGLRDKVAENFGTDNIPDIMRRHGMTDQQLLLLFAFMRYKYSDPLITTENDQRQLEILIEKLKNNLAAKSQ